MTFFNLFFRNFELSKTRRRREEFGGNKKYDNFAELQKDFAEKLVHPGDLKNSVGSAIDKLLAPIIAKFNCEEFKKLTDNAYPVEKKEVKKKGLKNRDRPCNF